MIIRTKVSAHNCIHCGQKILIGERAFLFRDSTNKQQFICIDCHRKGVNGSAIVQQPQPLTVAAPPNPSFSIDPQLVEQFKIFLALRGGGTFGQQIDAQLRNSAASGCVTIFWWLVAIGLVGLLFLAGAH